MGQMLYSLRGSIPGFWEKASADETGRTTAPGPTVPSFILLWSDTRLYFLRAAHPGQCGGRSLGGGLGVAADDGDGLAEGHFRMTTNLLNLA